MEHGRKLDQVYFEVTPSPTILSNLPLNSTFKVASTSNQLVTRSRPVTPVPPEVAQAIKLQVETVSQQFQEDGGLHTRQKRGRNQLELSYMLDSYARSLYSDGRFDPTLTTRSSDVAGLTALTDSHNNRVIRIPSPSRIPVAMSSTHNLNLDSVDMRLETENFPFANRQAIFEQGIRSPNDTLNEYLSREDLLRRLPLHNYMRVSPEVTLNTQQYRPMSQQPIPPVVVPAVVPPAVVPPVAVEQELVEAEDIQQEIERAMTDFQRELVQQPVRQAPLSRMAIARLNMNGGAVRRGFLSLENLLDKRALVAHPTQFPDVAFDLTDMAHVEGIITNFNETFHENDEPSPMNNIVAFIRHYGTIVIVCTNVEMMSNIMDINIEAVGDRNFRQSGQPRTLMVRRYTRSFFDNLMSFSTTDQLCLRGGMQQIARQLVPNFTPATWINVGSRRGFDSALGRVILEFSVDAQNINAARAALVGRRPPMLTDGTNQYYVRFAVNRFDANNLNVRVPVDQQVIRAYVGELHLVYDPEKGVLSLEDSEEQQREQAQRRGGRKRGYQG